MDLPLPCPLQAGWELIRTISLPRKAADGRSLGGFSAASYQTKEDQLWLLSDSSRGHLVPWGGLAKLLAGTSNKLTPGPRRQLRDPAGHELPKGFDGEGLVVEGGHAWIASEGSRRPKRAARLIRIDVQTGRIQKLIPLPKSWIAQPGQGLASNKGPESLTLLNSSELLIAAERPLLQSDNPTAIPIARVTTTGTLISESELELGFSGSQDGLTDLLALPRRNRLLALVRGFDAPFTWRARLLLYSLPKATAAPPLQPLIGWNLLETGLPADNWEALTVGPRLADGRTTLVLASDDNYSPFQENWLAVMAPRRTSSCRNE